MKIKIYGASGCNNCSRLKKTVEEIVMDLGINADVSKVEEPAELVKKNILSTPALSIDGDVKFRGKVPSKKELKELFEE